MITRNAFSQIAEILLEGGGRKATKFFSESLVLKGTKRIYKRSSGRERTIELLFTIGKPNYAEREFIKKVKKAGESFPVRQIQIKLEK